jgi:uncharacterized protein (TIGR00290 family)
MTAFASWSGGKDCMLALYRFQLKENNKLEYLVNMCTADGEHSRSHGLKKNLIKEQSDCLGIPVIQQDTSTIHYEQNLKKVIKQLKNQGVHQGVFGDIYLEEHRVWIERVCAEMNIEPDFPLWNCETKLLLKEFIDLGFCALTVSIKEDALSPEWLGRTLDHAFFNEILKLDGVDPCAENGEYHTFVFDGPIFRNPVIFKKGRVTTRDHHHFLELIK